MSTLARPLKWPPIFPLEKGLVLWLPFDERSGARALDHSGKANHGALYGPTWVAGRRGSALSFDGDNDYVKALHSTSLNITGKKLTLVAWIKPDDVTRSNDGIIAKTWAFMMELHQSNVWFYTQTEDGIVNYNASIAGLSGKWIHIALVYDGDAASGEQQKLYRYGALISQTAQTGNLITTTSDLHVGAFAAGERHFLGVIDEVHIYNRALTAAEVKRLYESEIPLVRH